MRAALLATGRRPSSLIPDPRRSPRSYTGYLDTDSHGRDLFFYFFLSRSKPERDDVLLWIK